MRYSFIILAFAIFSSCNSSTEERKIEQIIQTSSGSTSRFIQKYDENSNLIWVEHDYDKHGPSDEIYKYYYENSNLIKEEWFFRNGSKTELYMTDYYTYNSDNTIDTKIRKDRDDNLYWEFKYDHEIVQGERETTISQFESNGELLQEWFYKYDSIDRVIQEPRDFQGSIYGYQKYEYTNNFVQITEYTLEDKPEFTESYKIDKLGNYISVDDDNTQYKLKYDKYGNWIEKEIIQKNGGWTEFREITYY
ncbi:MAG: hypothetical protein ABJ092_04215 [Gillisia sp.]